MKKPHQFIALLMSGITKIKFILHVSEQFYDSELNYSRFQTTLNLIIQTNFILSNILTH